MAAVDEDGELDAPRAAKIIKRIHGGADGTPTKKDIIDEDDGFSGDVKRNDGGLDIGSDALIEVIAMHADVERTGGDRVLPNGGEDGAESLGDGNAAALNADESDLGAGYVALSDFVADAGEGALDGGSVKNGLRAQ